MPRPQPDPLVILLPRLLKRTTAAGYLGISPPALDLLRLAGELTPIFLPSTRSPDGRSRVPLYDKTDLDALIERQKGVPDAARTA